MIVEIIRFFFILVGAIAGAYATNLVKTPEPSSYRLFALILSIILGSGVGYVVGGVLGRRLAGTLSWIENNIQKIPLGELISSVAGLIVGLIVAFLFSLPAQLIPDNFRIIKIFYNIFAFVIFGWLGLRIGSRRWEDLDRLMHSSRTVSGSLAPGGKVSRKLLDTNIVIDGRIIDICRTGFLEGELILPRYVLKELHLISDSEDSMKRARGRRGLDVMHQLQQESNVNVTISETDYYDIAEVDAKLVRQAKETGAVVLTNDYNLNKVAALEGVKVLNINELANAVKPVVISGEDMAVKVIREGKELGQGVGYLDDGTMVVVEGGSDQVGNTINLTVTSVLQTSAGKMIFAKVINGQRG